jgi:hypothetical protein
LTDQRGQRPVEILLQNPASVRISEGGGASRVTSFDGTRVNAATGPLAEEAARLLLTFATDSPEAIFQQLAAGEAYRTIGSRHLITGPAAVGRPPEYVDLYQLLPRAPARAVIPGTARSKTVAFESRSGLIRSVSYHNASNVVITTRYEDWKTAGEEKYPSMIRRLEGGREIFRIEVQSLSIGAPVANGLF